ncbi:uncharacterized protein [Canis lupus baileyi]|uniref:uncharacterized protein isoform X2 n=1 Tax=Canis lupus baileyi TaxID=143281 RepID=UPI003B977434
MIMTTAGDGRRRRGLGRSRELGASARQPERHSGGGGSGAEKADSAAPQPHIEGTSPYVIARGASGSAARGDVARTAARGAGPRRASGDLAAGTQWRPPPRPRLPAASRGFPRPGLPAPRRCRACCGFEEDGGPSGPPRPPVPGNTSEPPWRTWRYGRSGPGERVERGRPRGGGGARGSRPRSRPSAGGGSLPGRGFGAPRAAGWPRRRGGGGAPGGLPREEAAPVGDAAAEPARPFLRLALDPVLRAKKEKKKSSSVVDDDLEDDLEGIAQLPQSRTELGGLHVQESAVQTRVVTSWASEA